jgi:hypothetical protein
MGLSRVGQNRIYTYIYTVYLVISKPKIPYVHRIYMVLANPRVKGSGFWVRGRVRLTLPNSANNLGCLRVAVMFTFKLWVASNFVLLGVLGIR